MKKIFLILLFTFLILNKGYAATGAATEYEVTMKKVELCSDATCTTPTIVGERDMAADIAAADAGATVGNYASTSGIPAGTYTHIRITMSRTFQITGSVVDGSTTCTTDGGTDNDNDQMLNSGTGTATSTAMYLVDAATYNAANGATGGSNITISYANPTYASSMTVSGDLAVMTYKLDEPFTRLLKAPVIKVSFNTENALGGDGNACVMWIEEPFVSISIQ
jgi:hypothetical protein